MAEYFDVDFFGLAEVLNFRLMVDGEIRGPLFWKDGWQEAVRIHPDLHDVLHELLEQGETIEIS